MRIRSTLAGLVLGAGVLVLTAPVALADTQPTLPPAPTSAAQPTVSPAPTSVPRATRPATDIRQVPETRAKRPAAEVAPPREPQVAVRPRGAAETGAGMEDAGSWNTGALVIGGVALLAVAGGGTVALRQARKQS